MVALPAVYTGDLLASDEVPCEYTLRWIPG